MGYEHILVERSGDFATVTMNRPQRRNALSLAHMHELIGAFGDLGRSDVLGIVLAGHGPVAPATSAASAPPSWPCPVTPSTPPPRWTGAWSTGWSRRPSSIRPRA